MADAINILTAAEVARTFDVSPETVRRWVREHKLKAWKTGKGFHIFAPSEVERFRKERRRERGR